MRRISQCACLTLRELRANKVGRTYIREMPGSPGSYRLAGGRFSGSVAKPEELGCEFLVCCSLFLGKALDGHEAELWLDRPAGGEEASVGEHPLAWRELRRGRTFP